MKKLLVLLFVFVLFSCEKPKRYLELGEIEISAGIHESAISVIVTNNSDMDIFSNVIFKLDGTGEQTAEKGCWYFPANRETTVSIGVVGEVEDAKAVLKKCE